MSTAAQQISELKTFLHYVVDSLLDAPQEVSWQDTQQTYQGPGAKGSVPVSGGESSDSDPQETSQQVHVIGLHIPKAEVGKIIGRSGRTADALRVIVQSAMQPHIAKGEQRVHLQIVDV